MIDEILEALAIIADEVHKNPNTNSQYHGPSPGARVRALNPGDSALVPARVMDDGFILAKLGMFETFLDELRDWRTEHGNSHIADDGGLTTVRIDEVEKIVGELRTSLDDYRDHISKQIDAVIGNLRGRIDELSTIIEDALLWERLDKTESLASDNEKRLAGSEEKRQTILQVIQNLDKRLVEVETEKAAVPTEVIFLKTAWGERLHIRIDDESPTCQEPECNTKTTDEFVPATVEEIRTIQICEKCQTICRQRL